MAMPYLAAILLQIDSITLTQFKNYSYRHFDFTERIVSICGRNGVGKTNLLDAIHYLCFTKSYFTRLDANNVRHGDTGFRIDGQVNLHERLEKVTCIFRETGRKEFLLNDDPYEKFSHHVGRYPCVVIAPDDAELITGDSRERRSFLDALLCQLDSEYMQQLIIYRKVLDQRNSLLRSFAETNTKNFSLLDVLDEQLIKAGDYVAARRASFLVSFLPAVKHLYQEIAQQSEEINLFYESELLQASIADLLRINRSRDLLAQRTCAGVHRDDLDIQFNNQPFKLLASQGQRKSLLFALKLAEMDVLKQEKKMAPLLLLDDVFEKLDEERITNLLTRVCIDNDGQVFITDTNGERLSEQLRKLKVDFQLVTL